MLNYLQVLSAWRSTQKHHQRMALCQQVSGKMSDDLRLCEIKMLTASLN